MVLKCEFFSPKMPPIRHGRCQWNRPCQTWRGWLCWNQRAVSVLITMAQQFDLKKTFEGLVFSDRTHATYSELKYDVSSGLSNCRMYQDKLASLKRQLQQLQEGNHFFFLWLKFSRNVPNVCNCCCSSDEMWDLCKLWDTEQSQTLTHGGG